ncbi:protein of unknown function (plasmid) [Azospirillum baldaniorum]|uniref:LysM domain-containing protein n=1 Tax=Azospirillum baldaniorum TaxID=1064539 RepID=A0A9P1JU10_9PROT|nr:protein of unknown function [Azospirillum baldaniorum]
MARPLRTVAVRPSVSARNGVAGPFGVSLGVTSSVSGRALLAALALIPLLAACQQRTGDLAPVTSVSNSPDSIGGAVIVQRGDSAYSLSRRYNVPLRDLLEVNHLSPPYQLQVGQRLVLPVSRQYIVQRGDTLYGISRMFSADMSELTRLNGLTAPYAVQAGQPLRLPGGPGSGDAPGGTAVAQAPSSSAGAAVGGVVASAPVKQVSRGSIQAAELPPPGASAPAPVEKSPGGEPLADRDRPRPGARPPAGCRAGGVDRSARLSAGAGPDLAAPARPEARRSGAGARSARCRGRSGPAAAAGAGPGGRRRSAPAAKGRGAGDGAARHRAPALAGEGEGDLDLRAEAGRSAQRRPEHRRRQGNDGGRRRQRRRGLCRQRAARLRQSAAGEAFGRLHHRLRPSRPHRRRAGRGGEARAGHRHGRPDRIGDEPAASLRTAQGQPGGRSARPHGAAGQRRGFSRRPARSWMNCQATRPERLPRVTDHSTASARSCSAGMSSPKRAA